MGFVINTITTGHYKKCNIALKGKTIENPVLIYKKMLGNMEIPLDKTTIKTLKHSLISDEEHEIIIEWKDGKLSQAILDNSIYAAITKKML